jgi:hypothetical protein
MPDKKTEAGSYVRVGGVVYPTIIDKNGTERFIENPVVRYLLDNGKIDLNQIAVAYQTGKLGGVEDAQRAYAEFNMMLGYSVCGFEELSSFWTMPVERLTDTEILALAGEEVENA